MDPKFSIIVPVYNETGINETITQLQQSLNDFSYEIIISDGSPYYSTLNLIKSKSIIKVKSKQGRGNGLVDGAKEAKGEILCFVHGDTTIPKNALKIIDETLAQDNISAGAFSLRIDSDKWRYRLIEFGTNLRTKITRIPYGDQTIFIKKSVYDKIGGFKRLPLMEDVELMQNLKKHNHSIKILKEKSTSSPRRWEKEGIIYTTIRNQIVVTLYYLGVSPQTLVEWYRAHKK